MTKCCSKCGDEQPLEDFTVDKSRPDGTKSWCKSCDRAKSKRYYAENREKKVAYYQANRERHLARVKAYQRAHPEKVREARRRYLERTRAARQVEVRRCAECGEEYVVRQHTQMFCKMACRLKARERRRDPDRERERNRQRQQRRTLRARAARIAAIDLRSGWLLLEAGPPATAPDPACKSCRTTEGRIAGRGAYVGLCRSCAGRAWREDHAPPVRLWTVGACPECGVAFVVPGKRIDRYCSDGCMRRNRRRRDKKRRRALEKGAARTEVIDLAKLAARDGWRCHLCCRKVSRKAWSIDHLVPLADGGNHTWDNVALAHWRCNVLRQHRGAAQLRLH